MKIKRPAIILFIFYLGITYTLICKDVFKERTELSTNHKECCECLLPYTHSEALHDFPKRESTLSANLAIWNDFFIKHGNKYWTRVPTTAITSRAFAVTVFPLSIAADLIYSSGKYLFLIFQDDLIKKQFMLERIGKNALGLLATPVSLISPDLVTNHFIPVGAKKDAICPYGKLYSTSAFEVYPKNVEEVQTIIQIARSLNKKIAIAGKLYSQGKQALPPHHQDILLHLDSINHITVDKEKKICRVGAGATWQEVQEAINQYGLSVRVSQASNIFSIGGSLSINCHGWDHKSGALDQTVLSIKLVDAFGKLYELYPGDELFHLAIGGNGLFGVIIEATFSLADNVLLECQSELVDPKDYPSYFKTKIISDPKILLHYYRLSLEPEKLFQEAIAVNYIEAGPPVTTLLEDESEKGRMLDRIELQALRRLNGLRTIAWKEEKRTALQSITASRNVCMRPPIKAILCDSNLDTEWLQEYFITPENLYPFLTRLADLLNTYKVPILNASVRFVAANSSQSFNYAPDGERFAVVLFFNQSLKPKEIAKTREWIGKAVDLVNEFNGSYYLAYQDFPTIEQFQKSYPNHEKIQSSKNKWDEEHRFETGFFNDYLKNTKPLKTTPPPYHALFSPQYGMRNEIEGFIENIFMQLDVEKYFSLMDRILEEEKSDTNIFPTMLSNIDEAKGNLYEKLKNPLSSLLQLKKDLAGFAKDLLGNQEFENYIEIGYPGRMIRPLKRQLSLKGEMIVVNTDQHLSDYLQTGFPSPVDKFVPLNHYEPISTKDIPSESVDLVSLFIGLHHVPEEKLIPFIQSIERVLRPGGKLIFMDHDAQDEKMCSFLSLIHAIFNAGTAVSVEEELNEYRNFHPLSYWIDLFEQNGLVWNQKKPLIRKNDPSLNSVIVLEKPRHESISPPTNKPIRKELQTFLTGPEWQNVRSSQSYAAFIEHTPFYLFPYFQEIQRFWHVYYQSLKAARAHYNLWEILTSEYTLMNTFIGTMMTIEYSAKGIISLPLSLIYAQPTLQEPLTTQVLIKTSTPPSLENVRILNSHNDFHLIEIPRYKSGSIILQQLGLLGIDFKSIENNQRIQVDLILPLETSLNIPDIKFLYQVRTVEGKTIASYEIPITMLGAIIRHLSEKNITIDLIHDF